MRHIIAVWKGGEEPDPTGVTISRMQPGSIYWFILRLNRNRAHDWITKKPKSAEEPKEKGVILTAKQMGMMYLIVDITYRGEDIIERVRKAKYDKYHPLYVPL